MYQQTLTFTESSAIDMDPEFHEDRNGTFKVISP